MLRIFFDEGPWKGLSPFKGGDARVAEKIEIFSCSNAFGG
jgi:hypothetical protein